MIATIKKRRSVRSYDGSRLSEAELAELKTFIEGVGNPYGVPVGFVFLEPEKHGLKSPVLTGETLYLAGKVKTAPNCEEAFGYSFEAVVLKACSMGLGTVWIGGTMNREKFEAALGLADDEVMPCVTPVGHPAKKMSMREKMMRAAIKADSRLDVSKIAYFGEYGKSLPGDIDGALADAIEAVRWAPSAVNKQPWRMIVTGGAVHFYKSPDKSFAGKYKYDLQKIDMGIALYHFAATMEERGKTAELFIEDPCLKVPAEWEYTASYRI